MPITLDGTNGITTPMYNGSITANAVTPSVNMKNRLINSGMVIDQRNAGASVSNLAGALTYSVDRWPVNCSAANKFTMQQNAGSVTPPAGFANYLGLTSSSAYSSGSSDYFHLYQPIEGYNIADLNWGTANAKTVTASFWVRASVTGTYGGIIINSAATANYPFTYTVNSANTWEQKTLTIVGPTIGTWNSTNGTGLEFRFDLGNGSDYTTGTAGAWSASFGYPSGTVKFVATNGGTLYLTGVQIEVGSTATSFDYRPYGTELALCQRYFQGTTNPNDGNNYYYGSGSNLTTSIAYITYPFLVSMRTSPTLTSSGTFYIRGGGNSELVTAVSLVTATTTTAGVSFTVGGATLTQGYGVLARSSTATANTLFFSAEL